MDGKTSEMIKFNLFGGRRSAEAIRSTGYKTTGNALGEIVDNAIQAQASHVQIIVEVNKTLKTTRYTENIRRIAVIDNGTGMNNEELRSALLFGEGSHFNEKGGLGKFGVGLPQASLSQGTVLKVWTWQHGVESSISSGYDLYDEEWRANGSQIPIPIVDAVPEPWKQFVDSTSNSGTIVMWANLDKLSCTKANTLFEKSEMLIGRMYRKWIHDGKVIIDYITVDSNTQKLIEKKTFRAVDPLFVMDNTIVSDLDPPVDPMFEELSPVNLTVEYGDIKSKITIRTSFAKEEIAKLVNKKDAAGRTAWGKVAGENIGLSIVREGRELELDANWTSTTNNNRDPRHRWWGAEVEFGRELDDVFGVTNDKQTATALRDAYNHKFEDFRLPNETIADTKNRMKEEEPKLYVNIEVAEQIRNLISNAIDKLPKIKNPSVDDGKDDIKQEVEKDTTEKVHEQQEKGEEGASDEGEKAPLEQRKEELIESLKNIGTPPSEINVIVSNIITCHSKFYFTKQKMLGDDSFFSLRSDAGVLIIILNTAHPLYEDLFSSFEYIDSDEEYTSDELKELLKDNYRALKYLLISWARMEDVAIKSEKRSPTLNRLAWGRQAMLMKGINPEDD